MTASPKPMKEDGHPSSFPPETGTDFFDRGPTSRKYALVGVACSTVISCSCVIVGGVICVRDGTSGYTGAPLSVNKEALGLTLNLLVTLCTESIGFIHSISLRSALASEKRLHFNTNLRLLTAAHGWCSPNGVFFNGVMTVLLIMSYSSSSLVIYTPVDPTVSDTNVKLVGFTGYPLLFLGITLLLQVVIALSGMWAVKILTWSSSPFDFTAAMVHHDQLTAVPLRCMRGVSDLDVDGSPAKPSEIQPSAWQAHPSIRRVIIYLWVVVVAYVASAALVTHRGGIYVWSFLFNDYSGFVPIYLPVGDAQGWILTFVILAVIQGPLTLGLHCSELIANVVQNERQWRCAAGEKGLDTTTNPLKTFFTNALGLILFTVKPALHWMFGLSFTQYSYIEPTTYYGTYGGTALIMFSSHIWNMCMALFIFACGCTFVALRRPRGPQPATYGHLQTLANLVDEWSPVMWWGHKVDGNPYCHAGTSDHRLPDVKMDCVYAGFNAASVHPSREMALCDGCFDRVLEEPITTFVEKDQTKGYESWLRCD